MIAITYIFDCWVYNQKKQGSKINQHPQKQNTIPSIMRLSLAFGADNCVRLKCYTEPKSYNRGDNAEIKRNTKSYTRNAELELQLSFLKRLDVMQTDRIDVYDSASRQTVLYRGEVLQNIDRIVRLQTGVGDWVPSGLSPATHPQILAALDLLNESRRSVKFARFGHEHKLTKLTSKAKLALREAGSILDRDYKDNIYLVTMTLPSDGRKQFELLARYSGYVIDRLQRLFRNIPGLQYYYVWEFQKRGALHLHYAVAHSNPDTAFKAARIMRTQFYKVLRDIGSEHNIDMFASRTASGGTWANKPKQWQWSIDKITKSVTGYLSKYLSKGSMGFTEAFYPARWWGCCTSLRQKVKACKIEITIAELPNDIARNAFYHFCEFFSDLNPALVLPYENHIHNTYLSNDVDGFDVRLPASSLLMSIWGCNFYFNPDNWSDLYNVLSGHFGDAASNFALHIGEFAALQNLLN